MSGGQGLYEFWHNNFRVALLYFLIKNSQLCQEVQKAAIQTAVTVVNPKEV